MFTGEVAEGIRLILTQYFLHQLKFGVIEGSFRDILTYICKRLMLLIFKMAWIL